MERLELGVLEYRNKDVTLDLFASGQGKLSLGRGAGFKSRNRAGNGGL